MKHIKKLPKLKTQLSYFEKKDLEKAVERDKKRGLITVSSNGVDYALPSFVINEIIKFELSRDFIFDNYKIILDCKGKDKQIVNCTKVDTCTKESCKRCIWGFSEVILAIDCLVYNASASLKLFDAKKINERNNLIVQIAQTEGINEEHMKIMLRTRLDNVVADIHKEETEINLRIVYLLNAKIKFIDAIEQTVKLYFDYHLSRISYYLENMPTPLPPKPAFSLNRILDICNSSLLTFYDEYRENAKEQKTKYEKQGELLHKSHLALEIAKAEYTTRGVLIDTDAANVDYKKQWVTKTEWSTFATAIAIARDAMSIVSTEQEVENEVNALVLANNIFVSAKKDGSFVDTTMLANALNAAEAERQAVIVSDNPDKVHYKSVWVTQTELKRLNDSITEAKQKIAGVRNDEQVVIAANSLIKATAAFAKAKKEGAYVDKSALKEIIINAEREIENIEISTTATNVDYKKMWVQQDKWDSYVSAIETAKNVLSTVSTDDGVIEATNELKEKVADFVKIKKRGEFVDKSFLEQAIKNAEDAEKDIVIDTDADNVDSRKFWVTQKEYDDLDESIMHAEGRLPLVVTDEEVIDESDSLLTAVADFNSCKKKGVFVDKLILSKEILKAENSMMGVLVDVNSSNVSYKNDWVTQRSWDILTNSIISAQNSIKNVLTDKQVKSAAKRMREAVIIFNQSKQKGTFVDTTILSTVIKDAEAKLELISVDEEGSNVMIGRLWATKEEWDVFNLAIGEARNAMNTVKDDEQVVEAAEILSSAICAFDSVLKIGLMSEPKADGASVQEVNNTESE